MRALENAIRDYIDARNEHTEPFNRTADTDNIRRRVKNTCMDTSDSER